MKALEAHGISRDSLPYKAPFQPYGSYFAFVATAIITFFKGFDAFIPFTTDVFVTYVTHRVCSPPLANHLTEITSVSLSSSSSGLVTSSGTKPKSFLLTRLTLSPASGRLMKKKRNSLLRKPRKDLAPLLERYGTVCKLLAFSPGHSKHLVTTPVYI